MTNEKNTLTIANGEEMAFLLAARACGVRNVLALFKDIQAGTEPEIAFARFQQKVRAQRRRRKLAKIRALQVINQVLLNTRVHLPEPRKGGDQ